MCECLSEWWCASAVHGKFIQYYSIFPVGCADCRTDVQVLAGSLVILLFCLGVAAILPPDAGRMAAHGVLLGRPDDLVDRVSLANPDDASRSRPPEDKEERIAATPPARPPAFAGTCDVDYWPSTRAIACIRGSKLADGGAPQSVLVELSIEAFARMWDTPSFTSWCQVSRSPWLR